MKHKIINVFMLMMNGGLNNLPSRHFRRFVYRLLGAQIGNSIIFRKTAILEPEKLSVGDNCSIGWHCLLDARGGEDWRQCKYF